MKESNQIDPHLAGLPPKIMIRRGAYTEVVLYEVEKSEFELLVHGTSDSIYFNFAVFLLSAAISFLTSLLTTEVPDKVFTVFLVITSVGFIAGSLLLIIRCGKDSRFPRWCKESETACLQS
jgi:hypothetical protein